MTTPMASASLYVGDLHVDVTEPNLFEIFSHVGPVASIRVCRDAVTRRSLGYAYVNFHNMVDAERALDTLNYTEVKGKPCRIMWKHRDPSIRKTGLGNVFIKNLDKSLDNRHLNDTFSQFGNIVSCKVVTDESGASKGYGYVQYETKEEADSAIHSVNGMLICQKQVVVTEFVPKQEREKSTSSENTFTNVFVKNLEESIDDAKLKAMFGVYGAITSAVVMKDDAGKSRCFGFVNFEQHEQASKACAELNGKKFGEPEKELYVGRAEKKSKREAEIRRKQELKRQERQAKFQGVNLYVKNLDNDTDDEKLRKEFTQFGTISSAKIMKDEKGHSKGFGFVCFATPEEATRAVTAMNGQMLGAKPIYVALHQAREQRKAQLQAVFQQRQAMQGNMQRLQMGAVPPMGAMPLFYPPGAPGPRPGQMFMYPQGMPQMGYRGQMPQQMQRNQGGQYGRQQGGGQRGRGAQQGGAGGPQQGGGGGGGGNKGQGQGQAQGNRQQGFKMNPGVRNPGQQAAAQAPAAVAAEQPLGGMQQLTPAYLASLPQAQQKNILGEQLYKLISATNPSQAGKITGMLLELDTSEVLHLIDTPAALTDKVSEAIEALNAANNAANRAAQ